MGTEPSTASLSHGAPAQRNRTNSHSTSSSPSATSGWERGRDPRVATPHLYPGRALAAVAGSTTGRADEGPTRRRATPARAAYTLSPDSWAELRAPRRSSGTAR